MCRPELAGGDSTSGAKSVARQLELDTATLLSVLFGNVSAILAADVLERNQLLKELDAQACKEPGEPAESKGIKKAGCTHQHPGGVLVSPLFYRLAQGYVGRKTDRPSHSLPCRRASQIALGKPPFNVSALIPATSSTLQLVWNG